MAWSAGDVMTTLDSSLDDLVRVADPVLDQSELAAEPADVAEFLAAIATHGLAGLACRDGWDALAANGFAARCIDALVAVGRPTATPDWSEVLAAQDLFAGYANEI